MDENKFALLTNEVVERNLINLHQITFEVTDACNLKCKYCAHGEYYSNMLSPMTNLMKRKLKTKLTF